MKRRDGQRGFTTVEFALTLPLLLTLLFGSIDGGLLVISRCMVSYAAVTAARTASLRSPALTLPVSEDGGDGRHTVSHASTTQLFKSTSTTSR